MSLDSILSKLTNLVNNKFNEGAIDSTKQVKNPFKGTVDASIFANCDLEDFKKKIAKGMNLGSDESIFYENINQFGVDEVFDYFDKNGDGKIEEDEIEEIASLDSDADTISGYDLNYIFNDMALDDVNDSFDRLVEQGLADMQAANQQAVQNYTSNIGGQNYQSYGSQTQNGSTISSEEQFTKKDELDKLQKEEIPKLEEDKTKTIESSKTEIDGKNEELDKLIDDNKDKLGKLGEDYKTTQEEVKTCETKISEAQKGKADSEAEIRDCESSISNLEAERDSLDTNTEDEEINKSNRDRKSKIKDELSDLNKKKTEAEKTVEEYNKTIEEQTTLKEQKEEELNRLTQEVAKTNPEIANKMEAIKGEIKKIEEKRDADVKKIDEELKTKQEKVVKLQAEIGKKTGEAESMTGSKAVQEALALAEQELKKGVHEASGNNDGSDINKYRNGAANGQPWCASFVSWIYGAGQKSDNKGTFGYQASVSGIMGSAQKAGHYANVGSYTPVAGDVMIQKSNGASHTGVVTGVDSDGTIHTIEGNSSNKVAARTYKPGTRDYAKISGWVKMTEWQSKKA